MFNKQAILTLLLALLVLLHSQRTERYSKVKGRLYEDFIEPMVKANDNRLLKRKLRVTVRSFKYIVALLKESEAFRFWRDHNTDNPKYISVEKQAAVFLYFLSRNYFYHDLADYFGLGGSNTISMILGRVADGLLEFKNVFIKGHTTSTKTEMLREAHVRGFSNCIGIIDGVVNNITSFDKQFPHSWTTRKSVYAMVSMVICDIRGRILWYSTGNCGSRNDRGIFRSDVLPVINDLTESIKIINVDKQYFIMGDSGFNCRDYCLVPFAREYAQTHNNYASFNYKLSQTRVKVEHLFGRMKNRWRWLMSCSRFKSGGRNSDFIECCFLLNNLLIEIQDSKPASEYLDSGEIEIPEVIYNRVINEETFPLIDMNGEVMNNAQNIEDCDVDDVDPDVDIDITELQRGQDFRMSVLAAMERRGFIS